jgi:hypothetical protein
MKIDTINVIQHGSAAVMLAFCIFYPLLFAGTYDIMLGILIWAGSLPFLYFPDLVKIPGVSKEEMKDTKKISIPAGWYFILLFWNFVIENNSLRMIMSVLFIVLIVYCFYYIRKAKKSQEGSRGREAANDS